MAELGRTHNCPQKNLAFVQKLATSSLILIVARMMPGSLAPMGPSRSGFGQVPDRP